MTTNLDAFFHPRGIAILGASSDPAKLGYAVARNLVESGYRGAVHLVNPRGGRLFDLPLIESVAAIPDPVDLAVVIVPAPAAAQTLREVGQRGIRAAILTSGGFREAGGQGVELEAEVLRVCREFDLRLIGPNCVGLLDTHLPFDTTFLPPPMPSRGGLAFVSHSGAFCAAVIDWSRQQGFGFSRLVSLGNQADLTETGILPVIADDPDTKVICLYLESIPDGRLFQQTAASITAHKPIVALKVGRTAAGQKAAASHTGAMAGSETALNAAFEKAGVLRAASAEQLFDWARGLAAWPLPHGRRVAILTSAGGPGVISADALEAEGLSLAALDAGSEARMRAFLPPSANASNPVDMLASANPRQYADCLEILLADPGVDAVLVITLPPPSCLAEDVADALIPIIQSAKKPVAVVSMGSHLVALAHEHFAAAGIPDYPFPERAASSLGALARRADFLARPVEASPVAHAPAAAAWNSAEELISAYGIPTAPLRLASSPGQAVEIARELGYPLVAKIASANIPHKSDIGGVLLDLRDEPAVLAAFETLMQRAALARPDARLDGITLQRQVPSGQEVIIGALRDPQFGPLVMFGSGGVEAEGLKDVAFALAPVSQAEAAALLKKTWAGRKLAGYRSIARADEEAVIDALVRLSQVVDEHPEIAEIEINPLRALSRGVVAVDVRVKRV